MAAPLTHHLAVKHHSHRLLAWLERSSGLQSSLTIIAICLLLILSGALTFEYLNTPTNPLPLATDNTEAQSASPTPKPTPTALAQLPSIDTAYIVQPGDSLWSVAEHFYGDGQAWVNIATINKLVTDLQDRINIDPGQLLIIPLSASTSRIEQQIDQVADKLVQYIVQPGDTLWSIAERFYGNGQQWIIIYRYAQNRLGLIRNDAPLIHAGNVIFVPNPTI